MTAKKNFAPSHWPGKKYSNADSLSRQPTAVQNAAIMRDAECWITTTAVPGTKWGYKIREAQLVDIDIALILTEKEAEERPSWETVSDCSRPTKCCWAQWDSLFVKKAPNICHNIYIQNYLNPWFL